MANIAAKYGLASSGGFMGGPPPSYVTNWMYQPYGQVYDQSATMTTVATRLYYIPFRVWEQHTFSGVKLINSGAGDNGETFRVGIYSHGTAGPNALQVDFGLGTLTGAAALRTLSASVALSPAVYWLAFHANSDAAWYSFQPYKTNVGMYSTAMSPWTGLPFLNTTTANADTASNMVYVDTTFGALASTAVAPTLEGVGCPNMFLVA